MTRFLRRALIHGVVAFPLVYGCGYVGLEELEDVASTGDGDGDGDGDASGGGPLGDGDGDALGGQPSGDGDGDAFGGEGGAGGFGGTGGTGGMEGGGGTGGTGGSGPLVFPDYPCSTDCEEPFLLYRTFEIGIPGVPKEDPGASVERTTETVFADQYALCASQGEPGTDAQITDKINRVVGGHLYYRAWMYVPDGAVTDWLKVLAFNGVSVEGIDVNLRASGSVEIYSQMTADSEESTPGVLPEGEWFCMQVHSFIDNVNGTVDVSINEQPVVEIANIDTLPGFEVDNVVYGIAETGPGQTGASIYLDNLAVANEPIPCE